jgi:hypothetical protein
MNALGLEQWATKLLLHHVTVRPHPMRAALVSQLDAGSTGRCFRKRVSARVVNDRAYRTRCFVEARLAAKTLRTVVAVNVRLATVLTNAAVTLTFYRTICAAIVHRLKGLAASCAFYATTFLRAEFVLTTWKVVKPFAAGFTVGDTSAPMPTGRIVPPFTVTKDKAAIILGLLLRS